MMHEMPLDTSEAFQSMQAPTPPLYTRVVPANHVARRHVVLPTQVCIHRPAKIPSSIIFATEQSFFPRTPYSTTCGQRKTPPSTKVPLTRPSSSNAVQHSHASQLPGQKHTTLGQNLRKLPPTQKSCALNVAQGLRTQPLTRRYATVTRPICNNSFAALAADSRTPSVRPIPSSSRAPRS
ncbi:hypothetical protein EJ04DRAFT_221252 [Polyplosphaeria fusca]|uniref:Uncharacterized protein n=1 Tax=Polyplosphaeria fusca TaxID=682080 RepID=A0A9P4R1N1_9PLEO|nr:hypothetical protein EJ04DRAFT_221252 [Polyplosphaeria fusca]